MKKEMRTLEYTEDHFNSVYAHIGNGISEGYGIDDFDPPLNEKEREIYYSIIEFRKKYPGAQEILYMD